MQNPVVSEPVDKLQDVYPEGTPFLLTGIRYVKAKSADYGEGEMVIIKTAHHERELSIWGSYLLSQAKSVEPADLNKWYMLTREVIPGFGKGRPTKVFKRTNPPATAGPGREPSGASATGSQAETSDIPF